MRTLYPALVVLALGAATVMWGLGGFGALYGADDPAEGLDSGGELEKQANDSAADDDNSFGGSASNSGDGDIVGLIISGLGYVADFFGMVVLLPWELAELGFPWWFAAPVGSISQLLVGLGIVQWATGRPIR